MYTTYLFVPPTALADEAELLFPGCREIAPQRLTVLRGTKN